MSAALLAAAGVRRGDTVLVLGGQGLIERAATAAAGPSGRMLATLTPQELGSISRIVISGDLPALADLDPALTGGGRIAVATTPSQARVLISELSGRGYALRHHDVVGGPEPLEVIAAVRP